jgi:hypothetical protein
MVGILLYILLMVFPLELGLFSIFVVKVKQAIASFLVLVLWSLGFLILPTPPEGFAEAEYGGWFLVLFPAVFFYAKLTESKKSATTSET